LFQGSEAAFFKLLVLKILLSWEISGEACKQGKGIRVRRKWNRILCLSKAQKKKIRNVEKELIV
jgi:hypothetical protein